MLLSPFLCCHSSLNVPSTKPLYVPNTKCYHVDILLPVKYAASVPQLALNYNVQIDPCSLSTSLNISLHFITSFLPHFEKDRLQACYFPNFYLFIHSWFCLYHHAR